MTRTRRLSPVQRAFLLGRRRGKRQMQAEMRAMADELDDLYSAVGNLALDLHKQQDLQQAIEERRDPEAWIQ